MDLATALRWAAERYPHRRALGGSIPMTYAEWDARTDQVASALHTLGATENDRVVFLLRGGEKLATLHLSAQKARVVSVPLSTRFSAEEVAYCIGDCRPSLVAVDETTFELAQTAVRATNEPPVVAWAGETGNAPTGVPSLQYIAQRARQLAAPAPPVPDDVSVMLYTSGTTGRPKGVPRTHRAEHYATLAHLVQSGQTPGDVTLGVMPLFHTMGLRSLLASILTAGTWVPQPNFDAEESLELIIREQITTLYLVPTMYWSLLRTGGMSEASSVHKLAYAGASMTPSLAEELAGAVRPERFINHFGSTEIYTFTIGPDVAAKPGCAGRAGLFARVRLVDVDPQASAEDVVGPGEPGQVAVSMASPEAFAGYWRRIDANRKSIRDGWYFTGDLAVADEDGDLWVSGRVDDMINSGGENIYPDEITNALAASPDCAEVVVAGTPHDKWGHAVTAYIVGAPGATPAETLTKVMRFAREQSGLPSLKRPKCYLVIDKIPKSAVGKVLRRKLIDGDYTTLAYSDDGCGLK